MTDQLNVSQRAREAASAAYYDCYDIPPNALWMAEMEAGDHDDDVLVQAFARFERELSTNKDETIAKLRCAVEAALNWIDQDDCSQMGPAEDAAHTRMIRRLEDALTSTEKEG